MKIPLFIVLFLVSLYLKSQTATVTPDRLNIFYRGLDNPVTVVVENCPCKNIRVKASSGEFYGKGCHYNYKICDSNASKVDIYVGIDKKGTVKWIDTIPYRLRTEADPVITIQGCKNGLIDHSDLVNSGQIFAVSNGSEAVFWIKSYSVEILRNNYVLWTSENVIGSQFQKIFIDFVRDICGPGDEIRLYNIYVTGKDCINREIKEFKFKLK